MGSLIFSIYFIFILNTLPVREQRARPRQKHVHCKISPPGATLTWPLLDLASAAGRRCRFSTLLLAQLSVVLEPDRGRSTCIANCPSGCQEHMHRKVPLWVPR